MTGEIMVARSCKRSKRVDAVAVATEDAEGVGRAHLLKSFPESIPDLFIEFAKTSKASQDTLILASLDWELKAAGLEWRDLANLLRYQVVAYRRANMAGMVQAAKVHPNLIRLTQWEVDFLDSIGKQKRLLSDKQLSCLQSITDSLNMSDEEWLSLAGPKLNGIPSHVNNHIGELH